MTLEEKRQRVKVLSIHQRLLIDIFNWWRNPPDWLALPVDGDLPEDCEILSVSVSWERRCIEALVCSKEFPICHEACLPERIPGMMTEMRRVGFRDREVVA